jgi:membrane-bound lytic murein transglycosylase D
MNSDAHWYKTLQLVATKKTVIALIGISLLVVVVAIMEYTHGNPLEITEIHADFFNYHKADKVRVPKKIDFAGEAVPVHLIKVRNKIARQLAHSPYRKSRATILHQRAKKYFPIIEPILKQYHIPDDFKYLALVESKLQDSSVSNQGAVGIWQIMPETGRGYGMTINDSIDERYDVIRSTKLACKYFAQAYQLLGNWTLVAASYHRGINGILREIDTQQRTSYYQLALSKESNLYVYKVLVMKELMSKPKVYGFAIKS